MDTIRAIISQNGIPEYPNDQDSWAPGEKLQLSKGDGKKTWFKEICTIYLKNQQAKQKKNALKPPSIRRLIITAKKMQGFIF